MSVALNRNGTFTVLAPGETVEIMHDLAGVYDFTSVGEGAYHFSAANTFNYVDATGALKTITASTDSHRFKLAGRLVAGPIRTPTPSKREVTYTGCSAKQQAAISAAAVASNKYVAEVNTYLAAMASCEAPKRWTTWFGNLTTARYNAVVDHFNKIGTDATSTNYDCRTCLIENGIWNYLEWFAYVHPDSPGKARESVFLDLQQS
ncbi:hypothetical protein FS749_005208 [Ceratobasidium sp. UAMH 11750]|nr:hypothetical protein FS749_005208 [Ceratobasidium sp. UAMH 11750]